MNIGINISGIRKAKRLLQNALCRLKGASIAVRGRYEHQEITPSNHVAKKMADTLDISIDYFIDKTFIEIKIKKVLYRLGFFSKGNSKRTSYHNSSLAFATENGIAFFNSTRKYNYEPSIYFG